MALLFCLVLETWNGLFHAQAKYYKDSVTISKTILTYLQFHCFVWYLIQSALTHPLVKYFKDSVTLNKIPVAGTREVWLEHLVLSFEQSQPHRSSLVLAHILWLITPLVAMVSIKSTGPKHHFSLLLPCLVALGKKINQTFIVFLSLPNC